MFCSENALSNAVQCWRHLFLRSFRHLVGPFLPCPSSFLSEVPSLFHASSTPATEGQTFERGAAGTILGSVMVFLPLSSSSMRDSAAGPLCSRKSPALLVYWQIPPARHSFPPFVSLSLSHRPSLIHERSVLHPRMNHCFPVKSYFRVHPHLHI